MEKRSKPRGWKIGLAEEDTKRLPLTSNSRRKGAYGKKKQSLNERKREKDSSRFSPDRNIETIPFGEPTLTVSKQKYQMNVRRHDWGYDTMGTDD